MKPTKSEIAVALLLSSIFACSLAYVAVFTLGHFLILPEIFSSEKERLRDIGKLAASALIVILAIATLVTLLIFRKNLKISLYTYVALFIALVLFVVFYTADGVRLMQMFFLYGMLFTTPVVSILGLLVFYLHEKYLRQHNLKSYVISGATLGIIGGESIRSILWLFSGDSMSHFTEGYGWILLYILYTICGAIAASTFWYIIYGRKTVRE